MLLQIERLNELISTILVITYIKRPYTMNKIKFLFYLCYPYLFSKIVQKFDIIYLKYMFLLLDLEIQKQHSC